MIFAADEIALIRARRKSQCLRPDQPKPPVVVGRRYGVCPGPFRAAVAEITISEVLRKPLGALTGSDVRKQGARFAADVIARYEAVHGFVAEDLEVWCISWVFGDHRELFDNPRLLSAGPGRVPYERDAGGRHHWPFDDTASDDYTSDLSRGLQGEPEAISVQDLAPYVKEAHTRDDLRRKIAAIEHIAKADSAIAHLRDALSVDGKTTRQAHRDLQKLERALANLTRRLHV